MAALAFLLGCAALGLLLGDRLGRSAQAEVWGPCFEALDELARRERLARLRGE